MSRGPDRLLDLAVAVADGTPIDWEHELAAALPPAVRLQIAELRSVATLKSACSAIGGLALGTPPDHGRILEDPLPILPCTWGPLEVLERIGRGSFGTVYRARDPHLDREVALKVLHRADGSATDAGVVEEGRLLARVRHPNIVTVHGARVVGGRVGIWMELLGGETLAHRVRQQGPVTEEEAVAIGTQLCAALEAVHAAHVVHRDIKAQNVSVDAAGRVVLMDFGTGLSPDTPDRQIAGTPVYLAPEVLTGENASARSDLYSLGVLLFYISSGRFPVSGRSLPDLQEAHHTRAAARLADLRLGLSVRFTAVVDKALAPVPSDRFATAAELRTALERMRRPRWMRVRAVAALAITLGAAVVGGSLFQSSGEPLGPAHAVPPGGYATAVTTSSPLARRYYEEAQPLFFTGNMATAERLLRAAIVEDPHFASGHILLAWALRNQRGADERKGEEALEVAARAVDLSGIVPDTERLFILGSAHEMGDEREAAVGAYEQLLVIDPDHFWALNNLRNTYDATRRRPRFLTDLYERRARKYPDDYNTLVQTARELMRNGDWSRARPYVDAAFRLTPNVWGEPGWSEFVLVYDAWLQDRPDQMLMRLERLRIDLESVTGEERAAMARSLGLAYLDLGRLRTAVRFLEPLTLEQGGPQYLALVADARDDRDQMRTLLHQHAAAGWPYTSPAVAPLYVRAGLVRESDELLARWENERFWEPFMLDPLRADRVLKSGRSEEARRLLETTIATHRHRFSRFDTLPFGGGLLLQASLSLARLEATSGAPARAIRVLEEADNDRSRACGWFQSGGYLWVRQRAELARLYAHVGRRREAERVAAQVRSLMALADEDHPLKNFQVSD